MLSLRKFTDELQNTLTPRSNDHEDRDLMRRTRVLLLSTWRNIRVSWSKSVGVVELQLPSKLPLKIQRQRVTQHEEAASNIKELMTEPLHSCIIWYIHIHHYKNLLSNYYQLVISNLLLLLLRLQLCLRRRLRLQLCLQLRLLLRVILKIQRYLFNMKRLLMRLKELMTEQFYSCTIRYIHTPCYLQVQLLHFLLQLKLKLKLEN